MNKIKRIIHLHKTQIPLPFSSPIGKKNSIDTTDLRHMLKRKAASDTLLERRSSGKASSSTTTTGDRDNKRRRKERDDPPPRQVMTPGKGRQADNKRKKQHGRFSPMFVC